MSADNWTICPQCVKRAEALKEAFVKKYYGKLDSFAYGKIVLEIEKAVEYIKSYSSNEHKPNKEILSLMSEKDIEVELHTSFYDSTEILQSGNVSCCLREDYEQGVTKEGNMYFHYSCSCDCGFGKNVSYKEDENVITGLKLNQ